MSPPSALPLLLGCDFTSRPGRRKPVVVAWGRFQSENGIKPSKNGLLLLQELELFETFDSLSCSLQAPRPPWVGGFDLPFGLPRELVVALGWPTDWAACMDHYATLDRATIRATFAAFCDARPAGAKFAHRACDRPAGSSPSMKWVNPPVAYMLHAGVPLLRAAGVCLPAHLPGGAGATPGRRIALEAYPGLLARALIGQRSYKSDERVRQTPERLIARKDLVDALEQGRSGTIGLGLRIRLSAAQREALVDDASGDALDAVLCLVQAAWATRQPNWGLPADVDPLEGWILTA